VKYYVQNDFKLSQPSSDTLASTLAGQCVDDSAAGSVTADNNNGDAVPERRASIGSLSASSHKSLANGKNTLLLRSENQTL
jgi:hypothetical protein